MNKNAYIKAKVDLYNIVANHSFDDYKMMNYDKHGRKYKKHRPYSLSSDTIKAKEIYDILYFNEPEEITLEQEEEIKGFLLIYRLSRQSYLKDMGGMKYHGQELNSNTLQQE